MKTFRIQFTITEEEMDALEQQAINEEYPNVAELSKARALGYETDSKMVAIYKEMVEKIKDLPSGTEFYLRDIITMPPIVLGRWLYEGVERGRIPNVKHINYDGAGPEKYIKE